MFGYDETHTADGPIIRIFVFDWDNKEKIKEDDNYSYDIRAMEVLFSNVDKWKSHKEFNLTPSQLEDWTSEELSDLAHSTIIPRIFRFFKSRKHN